MTQVHLLRGPSIEIARQEQDEPLWCFTCRKRLCGVWVLLDDPEPSYYEAHWSYRCDGCGKDDRFFPGCGPC